MRGSPKVALTCTACGKSYNKYASLMRAGSKPYCSRACLGLSKRHGSGLFCAWCDGEFYRRFGEQDLGDRVYQFCTRGCYQAHRDARRKADTYKKIGSVHEHRLVAAQILGRELLPDEVVHHIDLNKHNNDPANLAVLPNQQLHARIHFGEVSLEDVRRFSLR